MIAAGEVVDRPASAVKELAENAIDAGAKRVSVEIKGGGMIFIAVSDDGCGIMRDDLPKTVLRHATSKISTGDDIDGVRTLGFRGEALAAISSVSRMEIISKRRDETFGNRLSCDETGVELYETGCPDGTSVTVRDLFYNVPARRKFMKKDVSEAAACLAVCEKLALSHPEVSVSFTSDGAQKFRTDGDGKLFSAMYTLYGGETARAMSEVGHEQDGVAVAGYISKPDAPRGSRTMQSFFVNGRYVRSKTAQAAVEEAFRSYIPSGKFPAALLFITLDPKLVDVNVHPAKTEIKFSSEKAVFSAIYYAVLGVLTHRDIAPRAAAPEAPAKKQEAEKPFFRPAPRPSAGYEMFAPTSADSELSAIAINNSPVVTVREPLRIDDAPAVGQTAIPVPESDETPFRIIGEAFKTYIFAELPDKVLMIDKHAAHERLLYEQLRERKTASSQELLFPVTLTLGRADCAALLDGAATLEEYGFVIEPFGDGSAIVRAVPSGLRDIKGIQPMLEGFARDLSDGTSLPFADKVDRALYTMACRAAVKAGDDTHGEDHEYLVRQVLSLGLKYCPHGRPFIKEFSKRDIEKYFDRPRTDKCHSD